ncbi:MAG: DUF2851 family protein [Bacteroidia bacterium]|nr:DUF2851 family protein [Bacteroidia bacterium]MDW8346604.1 DUF2851 family protein [Bacteroidia bacterium]
MISETLLSYLWKYKKFDTTQLFTEEDLPIEIIETGRTNPADGPDFLDARIRIQGYLWAGNIEIDISQQNWELHKHHLNPKYNNVILHIIFEDSKKISPIYRLDGTPVPTLNLKKYTRQPLIEAYIQMQNRYSFIPCERLISIKHVPKDFMNTILTERLIEKSEHFYKIYQRNLDWLEVFWIAFAQGLGYPHNADAFMQMAERLPIKVIIKYQRDLQSIEALLFGTSGLLHNPQIQEPYYLNLQQKWKEIKTKHKIDMIPPHSVQFGNVRPNNFPTIRLMMLSRMLHHKIDILQKGFFIHSVEEWYKLFDDLATSHEFWDNHYVFEKTSTSKVKRIGRNTLNTMLINTILPVQFLYYQHYNPLKAQSILDYYKEIEVERNSITKKWKELNMPLENAQHSQVWTHLYKKYCLNKKCLSCPIGQSILS